MASNVRILSLDIKICFFVVLSFFLSVVGSSSSMWPAFSLWCSHLHLKIPSKHIRFAKPWHIIMIPWRFVKSLCWVEASDEIWMAMVGVTPTIKSEYLSLRGQLRMIDDYTDRLHSEARWIRSPLHFRFPMHLAWSWRIIAVCLSNFYNLPGCLCKRQS